LVAREGDGLQIWKVAANILNKQSRTAEKGWSSSLGAERGLAAPHHTKISLLLNATTGLRFRRKMDMRFGTWNVRVCSLYRAGLLMTVAKGISKYKLDLVRVQEVRWDGGGTEPAGEYIFFYVKENVNYELGAVKKAEFVSDRMSHIMLRDRWCDIIFLNVHAQIEDNFMTCRRVSTSKLEYKEV
jgi:hypothetical protein